MGSGGGEREIGPDAGAVLTGLGVGEADRSVMQVGDPAGDREAQAGPATTVDVAEGPEPFEGTFAVSRRDAGALVATSSCQRSSMTPAWIVTVVPDGLCRDALSSRLATS